MTVLFILLVPNLANALDINVTFAIALRELVADAIDLNAQKIRKDPLACKPRTTAANQIRARTTWLHGKIVLKGFGIEMLGILEKIVARGGLSKTAEGLGLIKDAVTSDSFSDFLAKRGAKKLNKKLEEKGVNKEVRKRLVKQLYESAKKALKGKPLKVYQETEKGACVDGSEVLTVYLDLAKGQVIVLLEATCNCNVPRNPRDPKVYKASVVGSLKPRVSGGEVIWSFRYQRANFGGSCCGGTGSSYTSLPPGTKGAIHSPGGEAEEEPEACDPATCKKLEKEIVQDHEFLKKMKSHLTSLNSQGKGDSSTATYMREKIASFQGGLRVKLETWKNCCMKNAGPSDATRIYMQWQFKTGVFARPKQDRRSSLAPAYPGKEDEERLAAIQRMLAEPDRSQGTSVQVPFGRRQEDLSAIARGEVKKRYRPPSVKKEENVSRGGSSDAGGGGRQQQQTEGAGSETSAEGASTSSSPSSSEGTQVATSAASGTSGFVGNWKGDGGCSLNAISITAEYTLKGAGPDIPLSVDGNEATGQGAVLFGISNHHIRLRLNVDQLRMDGSNEEGGSCVSMFSRVNF